MTKLTLGAGLFTNCTSLQKFSVKKGNIIAAWGMFGDCSSLSDIDFSIITVIDGFAFSGCTSLPAEIVINSAVTELGKSAFAGCTSLEKLILPQGLRYIHQEGLKNCTSLGELTIGKQTTLYANATNGCTSLKKVFYHGSEKDFKENTEIWEGNEPFTAADPMFIK
jgi:hypothetical protein